jgi:hypothetical protein
VVLLAQRQSQAGSVSERTRAQQLPHMRFFLLKGKAKRTKQARHLDSN